MPDRPGSPENSDIEISPDAGQAGIEIGEPSSHPSVGSDPGPRNIPGRSGSKEDDGIRGEPISLKLADAQRIAEGGLSTPQVLSLDESMIRENRISDAVIRRQVEKFLKRLQARAEQSAQLHTAPTDEPQYGLWLKAIQRVPGAQSPAQELRAIVEAEFLKRVHAEMWAELRVYLRDKLLEQSEHRKMVALAVQFGQSEAYVRSLYQEWRDKIGSFEEETEAQATQRQNTGWKAHARLAGPGELGGWNQSRLQDMLLQKFDVAEEIANLPLDHKHSLFTYLEDKDDPTRDDAMAAHDAAEQMETRSLAVWYYLWSTGRPELHVGGKALRTTPVRKRQVASVTQLEQLVSSENVLKDLAVCLERGLLGYWAFLVASPRSRAVLDLAEQYRAESRKIPDSKREGFLRLGVMQTLWALGLRGMPLWDSGQRAAYVLDLPSLVDRAEECWDALEWSLASGALALWLDKVNPLQAARARDCGKMFE